MGRRRGAAPGRPTDAPAGTGLGEWLRHVPAGLLRVWIRAAGGPLPGPGSPGLAATLEELWVGRGLLSKTVESCTDGERALLAGIAENGFFVPEYRIEAVLGGRCGGEASAGVGFRRALSALENAGLVVRLRHPWEGHALVVLPPVWFLVRHLCRPPLLLPGGEAVSADAHPNRFGPGALVAAVLGRVAQRPLRVTRARRLHAKDREKVVAGMDGYLGTGDLADIRLQELVVALHGAGLLAGRNGRILPDLAAIDDFAGAGADRRALRLLAAAGSHSRVLVRAAVALLDEGGAWCDAGTLLADAGWREAGFGPRERGAALLADLGLAEGGTAAGGARALRATPVLLAAAGGAPAPDSPAGGDAAPGPRTPRAVVQADFKVLAPEDLPLGWLAALAVHADLVRCDRMWVLELSPGSVRRAMELGATVEGTLSLLARAAGGEERVPRAMAETLRGFAGRCSGVRIVRGPVLFFDGPEAAGAARATLQPITAVHRVAPAALEIGDRRDIGRVVQALRHAGHAVSDPDEDGSSAGGGTPVIASLEALRTLLRDPEPGAPGPSPGLRPHLLKDAVAPGAAGGGGRPGRPPPPPPPLPPWSEEVLPGPAEPVSAEEREPFVVVPAAIRNLLEDAIEDDAAVEVRVFQSTGRIEEHVVDPLSLGTGRGGVLKGLDVDGLPFRAEFWRIVGARRA